MIRELKRIVANPHTKIVPLLIVLLIISMTLPVSSDAARKQPKWTIMVYLDGDNNLDAYGCQNIESMKAVGSTKDVNIIVLWDKYDDVANLYYVGLNELEIIQGFSLNGEEANMGDPNTLEAFVDFTMKRFYSDHFALILWDHGDDLRGCCWDDHPEDYLSHQEITGALSGVQLDILAFDACVEGMIEVVYEYAWAGVQIDYFVATEGYVPYAGFPYSSFLNKLTLNPGMSEYDLSVIMVDEYISFYDTMRPASRLVELGSINMAYVELIVEQLSSLADTLRPLMQGDTREFYHGLVAEARGAGNMGWSEYGWEAYVDLPTFAKTLSDNGISQATSLHDTLMECIYAKASWSMKSAEGMGIFFPNSYGSFTHNLVWHGDAYLELQFPYEGFWDFLQAYWG
ncbi:MAG: clostripain-related cysteine peptidase [Candidatus Thorarchaeota archaeon]